MTPGPVDDYVMRLERALRQHGCTDPRIVAEVREHLVDAVADGRTRGLSIDDAEREAFDRFGAPEVVAAQAAAERDLMKAGFAAVVGRVWGRKWWILAPTVVTAVLTSVLSYHFLPERYRAETTILVVSQRVPAHVLPTTVTDQLRERVATISQHILSRSRLERIIQEFGLYQDEVQTTPVANLVERMRKEDIRLAVLPADQVESDLGRRFSVAFVSSDPRTAMLVTERLASLFIMENLQETELLADKVGQFIEAQIEDVRRRIIDKEKALETLRARNGGRPLSQADLLPYEVLKDAYRTLLVKQEDSMMAVNIELRQIGEQFKIVDGAQLPEHPVGPTRLEVNVAGALVGLALGLVFVLCGRTRQCA